MIQNLPNQTLEQWEHQLDQALASRAPHLSIYDLSVEPGTVFARRAERDQLPLPPEELAEVPSAPASLSEALDALERDHEFLLKGDVFTDDIIREWVGYKRTHEVDAMRLRPHPFEFFLYFDA